MPTPALDHSFTGNSPQIQNSTALLIPHATNQPLYRISLSPLTFCSMRNCGILPSMSQDSKKNELEFNQVLRWIVCGGTQAESWPGASFCGCSKVIVFRALLEEYAPMNWPAHQDRIKGMKVESCPREFPRPHHDYFQLMRDGVQEAIKSGEEPYLSVHAPLLNSGYGPDAAKKPWYSPIEAPFRPNHGVCISRYDAQNLFIKDSNSESVYVCSTEVLNTTGSRQDGTHTQRWRYAEGCGPNILWIRSKPLIEQQKQHNQHPEQQQLQQ